MRKRWLGTLAGCLAALGSSRALAEDPPPVLVPVVATSSACELPPDRPTTLPPTAPTELPTLLPPPTGPYPKRAEPINPGPPRPSGPGEYDPSYLYLPETNPGTRQPPCPCLPLGRTWVSASYFYGTTENDFVPALVTGGGSPRASGGVPLAPGTAILFGDNHVSHDFRSGFRLDAGTWLDRCQYHGFEGSLFLLESSQASFNTFSPGTSVLARPYVNAATGLPAADPLAGPGAGAISITSPLSFIGAEANYRGNLRCNDHYRIDAIAGYRFVRLGESLTITDNRLLPAAEGGFPAGTVRDAQELFRTENQFHGGQIGLATELRSGRVYLDMTGKVAFGVTWETADIDGAVRATPPGGLPVSTHGRLLARSSNEGRTHDAGFAVVPEVTMRLGYQATDHWRAYLGYSFLYWSNVLRPGGIIDPVVGTTPAGDVRPTRRDVAGDFWLQGINLGFEFRY